MKKCPNCNSSRYHESNGKSKCDKCRFINDKNYLKEHGKRD
jgi:hypothetical protein